MYEEGEALSKGKQVWLILSC